MAGFKFKFQTILNLKIQIEKNTINKLAQQVMKLQIEKDELDRLEECCNNAMDSYKNEYQNKTNGLSLMAHRRYITRVNESIKQQSEKVNNAQKSVDKIRVELIEAAKQKKIYEKLKEKDYIIYKKEQLSKEQQLAEEAVNYKQTTKEGEKDGI